MGKLKKKLEDFGQNLKPFGQNFQILGQNLEEFGPKISMGFVKIQWVHFINYYYKVTDTKWKITVNPQFSG